MSIYYSQSNAMASTDIDQSYGLHQQSEHSKSRVLDHKSVSNLYSVYDQSEFPVEEDAYHLKS